MEMCTLLLMGILLYNVKHRNVCLNLENIICVFSVVAVVVVVVAISVDGHNCIKCYLHCNRHSNCMFSRKKMRWNEEREKKRMKESETNRRKLYHLVIT